MYKIVKQKNRMTKNKLKFKQKQKIGLNRLSLMNMLEKMKNNLKKKKKNKGQFV